MKREGFIFYQSFLEAGKNLPQDYRLKFYERILNYGIYGDTVVSEDGIIEAMFSLVKPQIDANNDRFENGKKGAEYGKLGGRPKKEEPHNNPTETPEEPHNNPTETPKEKEKEKEKVKDNFKEFYEQSLNTSIENRNATQFLVVCFFDLGYVPSKNETVESLREWLVDTAKLKGKTASEMIEIINSWHVYWKGMNKEVKNHKASLLNNFLLKGK